MSTLIDARGQACPRPVVMCKEEVDKGTAEFILLVDNEISKSNVVRFLTKMGYSAAASAKESADIEIKATKAISPSEKQSSVKTAESENWVIVIGSDTLGRGDEALGEVLIKAFIGTLDKLSRQPETIILMNAGVKLALETHTCSDSLKILQNKGCDVIVCGTCVNHFGISDKISVGRISNMFEIAETIAASPKVEFV